MLPAAAGSGSESTYYCDSCWSSTGWRVFLRGGNFIDGSECGLFTANSYIASSRQDDAIGSRLQYIPQ